MMCRENSSYIHHLSLSLYYVFFLCCCTFCGNFWRLAKTFLKIHGGYFSSYFNLFNRFAPEPAVTAHADPCPFYCMSQCHFINMSKSSSWPQVKPPCLFSAIHSNQTRRTCTSPSNCQPS